jgi:hypothetical protein
MLQHYAYAYIKFITDAGSNGAVLYKVDKQTIE